MVSDGFAAAAFSLGKIWRTRRRSLPLDVREAFLDLLIIVQPYFIPDAAKTVSVNIAEARAEVKPLIDLCAALAKRSSPPSVHVVSTPRDGNIGDQPENVKHQIGKCGDDLTLLAPPPPPSASYTSDDGHLLGKAVPCAFLEKMLLPNADKPTGLLCGGCGLWTPLNITPTLAPAGFKPFEGHAWNLNAKEFAPTSSVGDCTALTEPYEVGDVTTFAQEAEHDELEDQFLHASRGEATGSVSHWSRGIHDDVLKLCSMLDEHYLRTTSPSPDIEDLLQAMTLNGIEVRESVVDVSEYVREVDHLLASRAKRNLL